MKKNEITEFPQQSIDLMFWQYMQGAVDAINQDPQFMKINEARLEKLIAEKKARIKQFYNDREPSFDLIVKIVNGKFEVRKLTA